MKRNIKDVFASATVQNSNQLGGLNAVKFMKSGWTKSGADNIRNSFNQIFYTYGYSDDNVPNGGTILSAIANAFSSDYISVGFQLLVGNRFNGSNLYYRNIADSGNGGDGEWRQVIDSRNIDIVIKNFLDSNGYKPS